MRGPDAESYLQAMVSNDVERLDAGAANEALLLTSKARVIAPLTVFRRAPDDYLLLTEPGLGELVRSTLLRTRFAAKCAIELETHTSLVVLGDADGIPTQDYGVPAVEVLDAELEITLGDGELELLRIKARTPRFGREIDDRVLPAEAGLDERAIDFEKGCYPGQEPIARQHYRGRVNRALRLLAVEGDELPRVRRRADVRGEGGRPCHEHGARSRARSDRARLRSRRGPGGRRARTRESRREVARLPLPAPVAQGIERCPAEAEVASSNLAGRTSAIC